MSAATAGLPIEWGWAGAAFEGDESGDRHLVVPFPGGVRRLSAIEELHDWRRVAS